MIPTSSQPRPRSLAAVILAAGKGTRMRSSLTKVLHPVMGQPMVVHVAKAALGAGCETLAVVIGHQADAVIETLQGAFEGVAIIPALQAEQLGTGHAVCCAEQALQGFDDVLILCGDTPALNAETLTRLIHEHDSAGRALSVATFRAPDPTGYGRMVRDEQGRLKQIVEHRDANEAERAIDEVNAGIYLVERAALFSALAEVGTDNAQGEVYLTDIVKRFAATEQALGTTTLDDPERVRGINTRAQLAELEASMLTHRIDEMMEAGVTFEDPASVRVEANVTVGPDTRIGRAVQLLGNTSIGAHATLEAGCVLRDCRLGDGVHLKPYVVAEKATLADRATAGPFTHLRPGTEMAERSKAGNFVEMKNTRLGPGSKANHLSYVGDCVVGQDANIGAGTITCNYDGVNKHQTVIEDGVFIGSDTQLVAPVRVGKRATVGAGTTVTRDVPEGALVVTRAAVKVIDGYDERHRRPREQAKQRAKKES